MRRTTWGPRSAPTDQITDVGADAQLQYIDDVHALTARVTYTPETRWQPTPRALSSNSSDNLQSFKLSG